MASYFRKCFFNSKKAKYQRKMSESLPKYSKQMGAIFANCREICNSNIYCLNKFVDFLRLRSLKVKKVKTKAI